MDCHEGASPYPAESFRKTVVGVKRSDDVEIDTGSNVGRGLADEACRCASRAASRLGWKSWVAMVACWLCDARSPVIKKGQQDGRPNSGGLQTMNDCSSQGGAFT